MSARTSQEDSPQDESLETDEIEKFKKEIKCRFEKYEAQRTAREPEVPPDPNSDVYDFSHKRRGLALVINNENFANKMKWREGTKIDLEALKKTFGSLEFDVEDFTDLSKKKMVTLAKEAATLYPHQDADCLAFIILTHGDEKEDTETGYGADFLQGFDGESVDLTKIVNCFNNVNCPNLIDKPRLFFIQTCRGKKEDVSVEALQDQQTTRDQSGEQRFLPRACNLYTDCLIMYATPPGYGAYLNYSEGSWFVQELCECLKKQNGNRSLLRSLVSVCRQVATDPKYTTFYKKKQIPIIDSKLIKDIFMRYRY